MHELPASLKALMTDLIDYAGLFPPAGLPMNLAVGNYDRYINGPNAWALGRFVLPVARFKEFQPYLFGRQFLQTWLISALIGDDAEADFIAISEFNQQNVGRVLVDTVEVKVASADEIRRFAALVPKTITPYFEITPRFIDDLVVAVREVGGRAKIRTGGITLEAFPPASDVAHFISVCAEHEVPFKATAGLHHPVRCVRPITYDANAPTSAMHGFLNVFTAAAVAWIQGKVFECDDEMFVGRDAPIQTPFRYEMGPRGQKSLENILQQISPFEFVEHGLKAPLIIPTSLIKEARQNFAISFGSCSFEEPMGELSSLETL